MIFKQPPIVIRDLPKGVRAEWRERGTNTVYFIIGYDGIGCDGGEVVASTAVNTRDLHALDSHIWLSSEEEFRESFNPVKS